MQTATLDDAGRTKSVALSSGSTVFARTDYAYDAAGRPTCTAVRMTGLGAAADACMVGTDAITYGSDRVTQVQYSAAGSGKPVSTDVTNGYGTAAAATETVLQTVNGKTASVRECSHSSVAEAVALATTFPQVAQLALCEGAYLARNERYRVDRNDALRRVKTGSETAATATRALIDRWGISLPVDPAREPDLRDVIIPPERSPIILTRVSAPNPIDALPNVGGSDFTMRFDDGDYTVLHGASGDHRLWSADTGVGALALLLPLDAGTSIRLAAASRLFRRLTGLIEGPSPLLPTPLKLRRHLRLLRLLDGRRAGARARLLASVLIDPQVEGFRAAEWADCRQRKQIGRWTNEANRLMNSGYLTLMMGNDYHRQSGSHW